MRVSVLIITYFTSARLSGLIQQQHEAQNNMSRHRDDSYFLKHVFPDEYQAVRAVVPGGLDPLSMLGGGSSVPVVSCTVHVKQRKNWDCGLACLLMLANIQNRHSQDSNDAAPPNPVPQWESLSAMCATTSIWTVDLADLMVRSGLCSPQQFVFLTVVIGVQGADGQEVAEENSTLSSVAPPSELMAGSKEGYRSLDYYRDAIEDDEKRVNHLFQNATFPILKASVTTRQVVSLLESMEVGIIVLVDSQMLKPRKLRSDGGSRGYLGHYILVVGWQSHGGEDGHFLCHNPCSTSISTCTGSPEKVPVATFDRARKSYGTDEDMLVVSLASVAKMGPSFVDSVRAHISA
jgi:hypothetical protein